MDTPFESLKTSIAQAANLRFAKYMTPSPTNFPQTGLILTFLVTLRNMCVLFDQFKLLCQRLMPRQVIMTEQSTQNLNLFAFDAVISDGSTDGEERPVSEHDGQTPENDVQTAVTVNENLTRSWDTTNNEVTAKSDNGVGEEEVVAPDADDADDYDWHLYEENINRYVPEGFHPVRIGEIYNSRYEVLRKLGWGEYSTVWLVQDLAVKNDAAKKKYLAMKVLCADSYGCEEHIFEREILKHLRTANSKHRGYEFINHLLDDFEHDGPNGTHVCLVFEPMGETLATYPNWFSSYKLPEHIVKKFARQLLWALSYAHESDVIHTDIKPDNIFLKMVLGQSAIEDDYLPASEPLVEHIGPDEEYRIIRSMPMTRYYAADMHEVMKADADAMRAPEVFLGAGWDETVDLWSLGVVILEIFNDERMFKVFERGEAGKREVSEPFVLMQMQQLLGGGRFPASLLERSDPKLVERFFDGRQVRNYRSEELADLRTGRWTDGMDEMAKNSFVPWLYLLMKLEPRERPSIQQLLDHPWLDIRIDEATQRMLEDGAGSEEDSEIEEESQETDPSACVWVEVSGVGTDASAD
ncbi:Serine/threonine-protein kinase SRPK [Tolypocladium capitatum]|uniref:non-specific serine/threonine protein kinase n=1 Tax=Tolypocladium capitatum TaxID=45235 RepID=A0A2K3QBY2_9HYPO|nr:Serine/threonine-protein kinase SRPK [Tolypocladium capitatum]